MCEPCEPCEPLFRRIPRRLPLSLLGALLVLGPAVAGAATFTNPATIVIHDLGPAAPFPSPIVVSGMSGSLVSLKVTLHSVSHTFPDDIDVLLVSPSGQKLILVSDAGFGSGILAMSNVTVTFDDNAPTAFGDSSRWGADGTAVSSRPVNYDTVQDPFPAPAPGGPYGSPFPVGTDTLRSTFVPATLNGQWTLYVVDDMGQDTGMIAGGWSLEITTTASPADPSATLLSDGRAVDSTLPGNGSSFPVHVTPARSYSLELDVPFTGEGTVPGGGPDPVVSVTTAGGTPLATPAQDRASCSADAFRRMTFRPAPADLFAGQVFVKVLPSASFGYRYRLRLTETTMFAPWWSVNGYSALVDVQNTSSCAVAGTVTLLDSNASSTSLLPFNLLAGASVQIPIPAGLPFSVGSAQLTHDGPGGSIDAGIYMVVPNSPVGKAFRWRFLEARAAESTDGR